MSLSQATWLEMVDELDRLFDLYLVAAERGNAEDELRLANQIDILSEQLARYEDR